MSQSYIYGVEKSLIPYRPLPDILQEVASECPDQEAVIFYSPTGERSVLRNAELYSKSQLFAKGLLTFGFARKSVIAIFSNNSPEWLICTFGAQIAGLIPLHLSSSFYTRNDIVDLLNSVGACQAVFIHSSNADSFSAQIGNKIPELKTIITTKSMEEIFERGKPDDGPTPKISADDICGIFLTSGSTGMPKAIPQTHRTMYLVGYNFGKAMKVEPGQKVFNGMPFNWGGSYPSIFLASKVTVVTLTNILAMKTVNEINSFTISILQQENCIAAFLITPCIYDLSSHKLPENTTFPLKTVCTSGQPVDSKCSQIIGGIAQNFSIVYGCSELGVIAMMTIRAPDEYTKYAVGHPVEGIEIKIVDDNGVTVPLGTTGEIYVRGRNRFQGYLNAKEKSEVCCDKTGWYKSDDMGIINAAGSLVVIGRKSDMMIIAGDLVSPAYVESILKQHESVENAFVSPIYSNQIFQEACAAVVLKKCRELTEDELKNCFNERRMAYSGGFLEDRLVPKRILFMDRFPTTDGGKLDRKKIKAVIEKRLASVDNF